MLLLSELTEICIIAWYLTVQNPWFPLKVQVVALITWQKKEIRYAFKAINKYFQVHKLVSWKFIEDCSEAVKNMFLHFNSFKFLNAHMDLFQVGQHPGRKDFWDVSVHYSWMEWPLTWKREQRWLQELNQAVLDIVAAMVTYVTMMENVERNTVDSPVTALSLPMLDHSVRKVRMSFSFINYWKQDNTVQIKIFRSL